MSATKADNPATEITPYTFFTMLSPSNIPHEYIVSSVSLKLNSNNGLNAVIAINITTNNKYIDCMRCIISDYLDFLAWISVI